MKKHRRWYIVVAELFLAGILVIVAGGLVVMFSTGERSVETESPAMPSYSGVCPSETQEGYICVADFMQRQSPSYIPSIAVDPGFTAAWNPDVIELSQSDVNISYAFPDGWDKGWDVYSTSSSSYLWVLRIHSNGATEQVPLAWMNARSIVLPDETEESYMAEIKWYYAAYELSSSEGTEQKGVRIRRWHGMSLPDETGRRYDVNFIHFIDPKGILYTFDFYSDMRATPLFAPVIEAIIRTFSVARIVPQVNTVGNSYGP